MASITFPRKSIEKHVKLTDEVIEKISMLGTSVENIDSENITIEVMPNRPDMLSESGFIRALRAFLGKDKGMKEYKISKSDARIIVDKSVEGIRPYCMAAIVKNVKFDDEKIKEIMQWQEKIHTTIGRNRKKVALGYYILDKIKFPVKYLAKNPKEIIFTPLDTTEKMDALKILSKHPCGREYGNQLNGFTKFPVYYDSDGEVLSMPPIINSNNSGKIVAGTSDVLIECSGSDLGTLKRIISMAVVDLIDSGGKAYSVDIEYGTKTESISLKPEKLKVSLDNANRLLGLNLKEKELEKLLPKMGFGYSGGTVLIPSWRTDVLHEVDIIEDIGIAYGYENFMPEIPNISTSGSESNESNIKRKISGILTGLGISEVCSYHLIKKEEAEIHKIKGIELENAKTEYKILRPCLLIPSMRIIKENKDNDYPQKIFEIGTVFSTNNVEETGIQECERLLVACSPANFTEIKQILDYLVSSVGKNYSLKEVCKAELIDGRTGAIMCNGKAIGYIGELHPATLKQWGIRMPVSVIELNLDELMKD